MDYEVTKVQTPQGTLKITAVPDGGVGDDAYKVKMNDKTILETHNPDDVIRFIAGSVTLGFSVGT